jgi:hypothetical protein
MVSFGILIAIAFLGYVILYLSARRYRMEGYSTASTTPTIGRSKIPSIANLVKNVR